MASYSKTQIIEGLRQLAEVSVHEWAAGLAQDIYKIRRQVKEDTDSDEAAWELAEKALSRLPGVSIEDLENDIEYLFE